MPTTYDELDRKYRAALAQLTTLQAKLEAAEKDARRYRAMRDDAIKSGDYSNPEEFDTIYDAAIAQIEKEPFDQSEWKENKLPISERNRAKE